jgi:hypothetical protein
MPSSLPRSARDEESGFPAPACICGIFRRPKGITRQVKQFDRIGPAAGRGIPPPAPTKIGLPGMLTDQPRYTGPMNRRVGPSRSRLPNMSTLFLSLRRGVTFEREHPPLIAVHRDGSAIQQESLPSRDFYEIYQVMAPPGVNQSAHPAITAVRWPQPTTFSPTPFYSGSTAFGASGVEFRYIPRESHLEIKLPPYHGLREAARSHFLVIGYVSDTAG